MEYFDIYDAYGNKTGKKVPHGYKLQDGEYRFISHLLIFNAKNELLIQKRAEDKYDWPGYYDLSAGGGVNAGETPYQAAKRECKEELGLDIDFDDRPYMRVYFPNGFDDYFMTDCEVDLDKIKMQAEEVLDVKWATKEEIIQMQKDKTFVNYNAGFIDFLFAQRKNRGTYLK